MKITNHIALNRRRLLSCAAAAAGVGAAANLLPSTVKKCLGEEESSKPNFKYSICNETFVDWPFEKACKFAAQCGYKGIEIAPFTISKNVADIPADRRKQLRSQAEEAQLEVVGLHWLLAYTTGLHLTSPQAEVRRKTSKYLVELARFCADLGGKLLIFGSPFQRSLASGMSKEEGMKYAAEVIKAAVPELDKLDVTLALEPLTPAETNFINTAADAVELIKMVDSPRCRLILDCKAMSTESTSIPELIRTYRKWLVHFHANDANELGPGFGKIDFVSIMQALREIDYRGWISVEVFKYEPGPERLARESIDYLKKCAAKTT